MLVDFEHTKVGLIGGLPGISSIDLKHKIFIDTLVKFGTNVSKDWMINENFDIESDA